MTHLFLPLSKLLEMFYDLGEKFFDKNIRSGLGKKGQYTHKAIKGSLRKIIAGEEPPENFTFYHNGVSLTADKMDLTGSTLTLFEPHILNGAQTIVTLKSFAEDFKVDNRLRDRLSTIKVMARIVRSKDEEFKKKVTISNNRQNPIHPWNLMAHDLIQLQFDDRFRDELGIYYERRENAFANLTDEDLKQMGITELKPIEMTKFAQTLLAIQGEIDRISRLGEVFENPKFYKNTYKNEYLECDPKQLVLFYKIQLRLRRVTRDLMKWGKYFYVKRARNLIWALLIQAIMNEEDTDKLAETYGQSLSMEVPYTSILKDLASRRIRLIMGQTFEKKKYVEYLNNGKYSFLASKGTYDDCMDTARKSYGWVAKEP